VRRFRDCPTTIERTPNSCSSEQARNRSVGTRPPTARTGRRVRFREEAYTPLLSNVQHVPYPYPFQQGVSEAEAVERAVENVRELIEDPYSGFSNPAGIWVEPIQGEGGVVVPPTGFLTQLREIATENDVPLIVDEIQTGLGRTGQWFATEWEEVTPDVMPMAKALGGIGLPLSATMYHEDLDTWGPGGHVGTWRGNVPAMRAGVRAIEYIQAHDLLEHAREVGSDMRTRLREVSSETPEIGEVRGKGLFTGVEFVDEDGTPDKQVVLDIQTYCYEHGVLVWSAGRYGNVLRIMPPLVITHELAATGMDIVVDAIEANTGGA
jgi:diaminobutyrate-2-oxoglutarate transaminase